MSLLLNVLPLVLIIALLVMRKHMLVAGLAGGVLAVIIGGLDFGTVNSSFMAGLTQMLGITVPILYAAAATMVARAGSIKAVVGLASHYLKGRIAILGAFLVLIQALATYMAGMGAGNTMVVGPLVAAAVGAVPEVIAAMAIVSAVAFTTSPASTETVIAAQTAGTDVVTHASAMLPYTALFILAGCALAAYGVYKRGSLVSGDKVTEDGEKLSIGEMWRHAIPATALLIMVIAGGKLNGFIGFSLFTPATTIIFAALLTVIFTRLNANETAEALSDGARFILVTLFSVGIFLGFINMIGKLGTFEQLAALAGSVPEAMVLPAAMILGFLIAFPSGAFTAGVLALVLPTLGSLGMPSLAMGFVAMAVGLGTQISPVQINVAALADGFDKPVMEIVNNNLRFVVSALVIVIVVAMIAV